jgi:putative transposase
LDLGIKDFIVDSNRNRYENKHFYKNQEKKLKKLQRQLSKKQKGSNNRNKLKIKLAKVHEKISNQRNTYLHQITSKLVNENQIICIEDLNVKGMMSNHKLAKSIQELSLYEFRR